MDFFQEYKSINAMEEEWSDGEKAGRFEIVEVQ
jgi:hypothetical protein